VEVHFRGQVTGEDEAVGLRDEVVGHVDRVRDAVSFPEGLPVTAHGVAVLNVIMDQEEVMEDFGRQGERQRLLGFASQRLARDQAEGGAEPLTSTRELIPNAVGDVRHAARGDLGGEKGFDAPGVPLEDGCEILHEQGAL
jgi:hypothetical protein